MAQRNRAAGYEYSVIQLHASHTPSMVAIQLNELDSDGWELVSMPHRPSTVTQVGTWQPWVVLRRRRQEGGE
jgi:hypothetical protein